MLKDAQDLGYAEADPAADVDGLDAADKIAILATLAFGGSVERAAVPTEGISGLQGVDVDYANQLGYGVKLLAVAERMAASGDPLPLSLRAAHARSQGSPLAGVNGVNNAILVEGDPIGRVMFYGPGAGAGPTASAVVADILNIAGIRQASDGPGKVDPAWLRAAGGPAPLSIQAIFANAITCVLRQKMPLESSVMSAAALASARSPSSRSFNSMRVTPEPKSL